MKGEMKKVDTNKNNWREGRGIKDRNEEKKRGRGRQENGK